MKKWIATVCGLLFVPQCAGCAERQKPGAEVLCEACLEAYEREKEQGCPYCGGILSACQCAGDFLKKNGISHLGKLFRYYPKDADAVTNRMIYLLKHRAPRPLVNFLARDLAATMRGQLPADTANVLVTFAPRSRRARKRYGFDHMEHLSRAVAEELSLRWECLLCRDDGSEQKRLFTRKARLENMKNAFSFVGKESLVGKTVLLLDDITTSGATLIFSARALRRAGAKKVLVAVIGETHLGNRQ